jgi:hypothetical protein
MKFLAMPKLFFTAPSSRKGQTDFRSDRDGKMTRPSLIGMVLATRYKILMNAGVDSFLTRWFQPVNGLGEVGNSIIYRGLRYSSLFESSKCFFQELNDSNPIHR